LKSKIDIENHDSENKRILPVKNKDIDDALMLWIELMNKKGLPISSVLIKKKALKYASDL
jgi:hypothetical protein